MTMRAWHSFGLCKVALAPLLLASANISAAVCRVAVDGVVGNDGTTWDTPKDLPGALADTSCSELWLKQGVYKPVTTTTTPTTAQLGVTFQISRDLLLYGGYAGSGNVRDPVLYPTILSGDIQGDDTDPDANGIIETADDIAGSNSYHVVTMGGPDGSSVTAATLLDGITITAGQATGRAGGGLMCWAFATDSVCSPRLNDVDFRGNSGGQNGGGMLNWAYGTDSDSSPSLTRVRFSGNFALGGGGMANLPAGQNNSSSYLNRSSPSLVDVAFVGNSGGSGGGMYSRVGREYAVVSPQLHRVTFSGNTADTGGAMYIWVDSLHTIVDPVLSEVTFSNNSAFNSGGAIKFETVALPLNNAEVNPVFSHVTFVNNHAGGTGGAIDGPSPTSTGHVFAPSLSHVIFWANTASHGGDDVYLNSLPVWGAFFEYTIMSGGCVPVDDGRMLIFCGDGNLTADPMLGSLQDNGGFTKTHLPAPGSPAIDAGDPGNCSGVDQRGVARPQGARCDIGSVEVTPADDDHIFADGFEN